MTKLISRNHEPLLFDAFHMKLLKEKFIENEKF